MKKRCFKCGAVKCISLFYRHPKSRDGYLNKCKKCTKRDVSDNYAKNREKFRLYDKRRSQQESRIKNKSKYSKNFRLKNPGKYKAWYKIKNYVRNGRIKKCPCSVCGSKSHVEGHHHDYRKPLEVTWLCFKCHRQKHGQVVTAKVFIAGKKSFTPTK